MSQQTMRGMRLGASSLETDSGVRLESRSKYPFLCSQGHSFEIQFAQTAEIPDTWECKTCSREAIRLVDGATVELAFNEEKTPRSHWQMLLERRSLDELEEILSEQLANLRARREAAQAKQTK